MKLQKNYKYFFFALFFLVISLPLLDNIFHFSPVQNLFEKRLAQPMPERPKSFLDLQNYPKKFEDFFNDHYGFRKSLIFANGKIMDNIFNESPSQRAIIGKDGWLYFDNQNSILDFQGLIKVDEKILQNLAQSLVKNWHKLRAQNIDYVLVIAADKSSIYPEFLPDFIKQTQNQHRADQLISRIRKISPDFPLIDLRFELLFAKKNEIIYYKTDTHWNRRGAFVGYDAIMSKLGLQHFKRSDFLDVEKKGYGGDIANIMALEMPEIDLSLQEKFATYFKEIASDFDKKSFHRPKFFKNENHALPILLVYKDSFFDKMLFFFANHFSRSYFINEFPCDLDLKIVQKFHPNIVIQEFWEGRVEEVAQKCN